MKIGIFSPYWQTFGGGERYLLSVAEFFQNRGDQVNIFWKGESDIAKIKQRFNLDLSRTNFVSDIFSNNASILQRYADTSKYDLIFYVSDGSIPTLFAKKNILHFQVPFNFDSQKTLANKLKLLNINKIICNSIFTKRYIDKTYGVNTDVIYPPVEVNKFHPGKKENVILSVGRFFGPMHPKKQEILIRSFKKMEARVPGWELVLVGGVFDDVETRKSLKKLESLASGSRIEIMTDSSFFNLQRQYRRAKIYWHATGYGEDLGKYPEKAEHFGITTVEAMSAGCVPVVFGAGGQLEIIEENETGFFWKTTDELVKKTLRIISDFPLQKVISRGGIKRAEDFSKQRFFEKLAELL